MTRSGAQASSPTLTRRSAAWLTATLLLLTACAGELGTQGEALRFLAADLPDANVGEAYRAPVHAVGGLRPYEFTVDDGALPPGLSLVSGVLQGVPTTLGDYTFTLKVSDANLSSTFQELSLRVVEPPPPSLTLSPPETEVRGAVTLRARVADARSLAGLSTQVAWDPARFRLVEGSVTASRTDLALFHLAEAGSLQVDLAVLDGSLQGGAELFRFALEPVAGTSFLEVTSESLFASRRGGEVLSETAVLTEGRGATDGADVQPGPQRRPGEDQPTDPPSDGADDPDGSSGEDQGEPGGTDTEEGP